jgi:hypothetical protein
MERLQDVEPALVADGQPPEAGEPGQGALDHPAVPTQALAALHPAPRDARDYPPPAAGAAATAVVIAFVGVQLARPLARASDALPDRRHGVEQGLEEPAVVDVRGAEQERERDAAGVHEHVPLGARLAAVGRARADALAPLFAANEALSSEQRPKSIAFARPRRSSSARWSRSKTPPACQSLSLRQQVMPEPKPSSCGRLAHGMPVRSTKTMPSSALRSSRGGRPPFGRAGRSGSSGAISAQSASGTSGSAIHPG